MPVRSIDQHSDTWKLVASKAEIALNADLRAIEAHGLDAEKTEFLRGRIAAHRSILRLAETGHS